MRYKVTQSLIDAIQEAYTTEKGSVRLDMLARTIGIRSLRGLTLDDARLIFDADVDKAVRAILYELKHPRRGPSAKEPVGPKRKYQVSYRGHDGIIRDIQVKAYSSDQAAGFLISGKSGLDVVSVTATKLIDTKE